MPSNAFVSNVTVVRYLSNGTEVTINADFELSELVLQQQREENGQENGEESQSDSDKIYFHLSSNDRFGSESETAEKF